MTYLRSLHLNGLRAVEAVARLGTLTAAAEEIGVSPGAVSQQVIRTETAIGRPLFARTVTGMTPLAGARAFLDRLNDGFRHLDAAVAMLAKREHGRLTVSVAPVFAAKWLVPRLGRFQALHPDIQILIDATVVLVDLARSEVDLAIRVGKGPWPGVRADKLIDQRVFPVCSPAIAGQLQVPEDLQNVPVIRDANSNVPWSLWLQPLGLSETQLRAGPTYSDSSLCLDAAIAGQGVFLAWQTLAADALLDGRLVRPFAPIVNTGQSYFIVSPSSRRMDEKARLFDQWLRHEIAVSLESLE